MKKLIQLSLVAVLLLALNHSYAQTKDIIVTGKVISFEESLGLEGVSIAAKNSGKSSGTQADGTFSIPISKDDNTLIFSLAGYQTQELKIGSDSDYTIALRRSEETSVNIHQHKKVVKIFLTVK